MTTLDEARVRSLLAGVDDPHAGKDILASDAVKGVGIDGDRVSVDIQMGYPMLGWQSDLATLVRERLEGDAAISAAAVSVGFRVRPHQVQSGLAPLPNVKNIIAVASGKGGVGKSTVSANLALALQREGASVGVLDADIHGPSQPRMFGLSGKPDSPDGKHIEPKANHGIQVMSVGFLIDDDTPVIWRGPMVTQALHQLLYNTAWNDLDYLIIDLPPGTGDVQLTLCQRIPVAGALIVTTPQDVALLDATKALRMFDKVKVPVLGIIENMSTYVCPKCGHEEHIFGSGGGEHMAAQHALPLLGSIPLDIRIRAQSDSGTPIVAAMPDSELALRYREIARTAAARLSIRGLNKAIKFPKIVVQDT